MALPAASSVSQAAPSAAAASPAKAGETKAQVVASQAICAIPGCGKPGRLCARCKFVPYCGKECQTQDWKQHKPNCIPWEQCKAIVARFRGNEDDLNRLLAPVPGDHEDVCNFMDEHGAVRRLTQREFFEMSGAKMVRWFTATPQAINKMGSEKPLSDIYGVSSTDKRVVAFDVKGAAEIYVVKEAPPLGLGVCPAKKIANATLIFPFFGEIVGAADYVKTYKDFLYHLGNIKADILCGVGPLINDGPPNCTFLCIHNYHGLQDVPAVFSLREIQEKEKLRVDYGPGHPVKLGKYILEPERYQEVVTFCVSGKFYQPENDYDERMRDYILATPKVFIKLHLQKVLDIKITVGMLATNSQWLQNYKDDNSFNFIDAYQRILPGISRLHSVANADNKFVEIVDDLSNHVSASVYMTLIDFIHREPEITPALLEKYKQMGKFRDFLYEFLHGSLTGSYLGKADQDKMPKIDYDELKAVDDLTKLMAIPPSLAPHHLEFFLSYFTTWKRMALKHGLDMQAKVFAAFLKLLAQKDT